MMIKKGPDYEVGQPGQLPGAPTGKGRKCLNNIAFKGCQIFNVPGRTKVSGRPWVKTIMFLPLITDNN